jgi:hypothetical protein
MNPADYACHSPITDPSANAAFLDDLPTALPELSEGDP